MIWLLNSQKSPEDIFVKAGIQGVIPLTKTTALAQTPIPVYAFISFLKY